MIEKFQIKRFHIFFFILVSLILAHIPILWADYLRHDDWNVAWWNYHRLFSHPSLDNAIKDLFRPIAPLFFLPSDYFAKDLEVAKYVRFVNILLLATASYLTYIWQIKFSPEKKIFAVCFAIAAFTLQGSQWQSSTANYGSMIVSTIFGQIAAFYSVKIFDKNSVDYESSINRRKYYILSILFMMLGIMNYAPCAMFYFVFLAISYFSNIREDLIKRRNNIEYIVKSSVLFFLVMVFYVLIAKLFYLLFQIAPSDVNRSINIDFNILAKIFPMIAVTKQSFDFFNISNLQSVNQWLIFSIAITPFLAAVFKISYFRTNNDTTKVQNYLSHPIFCIFVILILFVMSYAPYLVPLPTTNLASRNILTTMPFALYIFMWSVSYVFRKYNNEISIFLTCMFIILCNHHLSRYIVGPHQHEMNYIRSYIERDVLPKIEDGKKVTIYLLQDNRTSSLENNFRSMEYGMTINYSNNWLISAANFIMRQYGYESSINPWKVIKWNEQEEIYIKTYWGAFLSSNKLNKRFQVKDNSQVVVIDMSRLGTYR
jgi:hypothetical protein